MLEPGLDFKQSHAWRSDSTKLILTWEAVKVVITWLSFSRHGFISTVGTLTAAFFCGKNQMLIENFMLVVLFWRLYCSSVKTASVFKSLKSKPS